MEEVRKRKNAANANGEGQPPEEEIGMEELLGPEIKVEPGRTVTVRVIGESPEGFLVDLGMKSEGLIPRGELESAGILPEVAVGAEVPVVVVQMSSESGHPIVSYRRAREKKAWETILAAAKENVPVEGAVRRKIKGGLTVDIGAEAFLPASQVELGFVKDLDKYIGRKMSFLVTEINPAQRNIVVSRRKLLEREQKKRRGETLATLSEEQLIEGKVTSITDFGAFVDIGGIEGLVHISDIAWHRVEKVGKVLKAGQQVKVKVLKIDREKEKISLGIKQTLERPWETAAEKYPAGSVVKGKVTSITDFGVFVEVEPGIEGLLHMSEISWDGRKENLKTLFSAGQEIEVRILAVDTVKEKLSLSLKRVQANPWEEAQRHYSPGARVRGTVTHMAPFGAFVRLPEGIEGLIHVSDMSWTKKVRQPQDMVQVGQEVEAVVLEVNPGSEKISLSLKHLAGDPFVKYRAGKVVKGTVKRLADFGAFVELEPGVEALVRNAEIAMRKIESPSEVLSVDQPVEAKVIKSDPRERKIEISLRKLEHDQEKELIRKYSGTAERPTLGDVLEEEEE